MKCEDIVAYDVEDLNESDVLVLSIVSKKNVMRTRLQKTALIYNKTFENETVRHVPYSFGGYSEEIDESIDTLIDIGAINEGRNGYSLTDYGADLIDFMKNRETDSSKKNIFEKMDKDLENLSRSLSEVSDKWVVGLTYNFYPDLSSESTIKSSVERMNESLLVNDICLKDFEKPSFENAIRDGKLLSVRRV